MNVHARPTEDANKVCFARILKITEVSEEHYRLHHTMGKTWDVVDIVDIDP